MSERITLAQLIEVSGSDRSLVIEFVEIGWLTPAEPDVFTDRDLYRLRKALRLMDDFELTPQGTAIIVDLMERVEELEREVASLRRMV